MSKVIDFSGSHLQPVEIATHHNDCKEALKEYLNPRQKIHKSRFPDYKFNSLPNVLRGRIRELEHTSSLSLLAAIEAAFRIDYYQRILKSKSGNLSNALKLIYDQKGVKASLEEDILTAWSDHAKGVSQLVGDLKGAFKYRHWLAHGRYWAPKLSRSKYDYETVYTLADNVFYNFPFVGVLCSNRRL